MFPQLPLLSQITSYLLPIYLQNYTQSQFLTQDKIDITPTTYSVQTPPLTTDWTYKVGTDPWPEYPRPQMVRDEWKSLNGIWSWRNASSLSEVGKPPSGVLEREILVPSCIESGLSGIMAPLADQGSVMYSWFRTEFDVPEEWDQGVMINFGAVDYEATVYINGQNATFHRGGYDRFWTEISSFILKGEKNELVVFVHDPTDSGDTNIPMGKQTLRPSHIFYTPCTGIWQSVFIEPVPKSYIETVDVTGDMHGVVDITVHTSTQSNEDVHFIVHDTEGRVTATHTGRSNTPFTYIVPNPDLWSPDTPNLYDIVVKMGDDEVKTYMGFRTIERGYEHGLMRPLLNGEFVFAFGTLDQGFWPDGIYTPPNLEAMKYDLQVLKGLGFNMVRKHVKVETDLFYRACDEMGMLVMQDMPCLRALQGYVPNAAEQAEFERQLFRVIDTHKSFPSIYTWVIYNENWGQLDTAPETYLTPLVHQHDPSRLINSASGWDDHGAGDYLDNHHYSDPQCGAPFYGGRGKPYDPQRIGFQGEFGGLGHNVSIDHLWNDAKALATMTETYELDETIEIWNYRAHILLDTLRDQVDRFACSGAVWTQTTDTEGEVNGLLTYDRRVLRVDEGQWKRDIEALYEAAKKRSLVAGGGL